MSHSKLVGAPVEIDLGPIKLVMRPLNDRDMAELDEWVRAKYIANARRSVEGENATDPATWKRVVSLAMEIALGLTWSTAPGSKVMATLDGIVQLAWQGAKEHTPGLTLAKLRQELMDPKNMFIFEERWAAANSVPVAPAPKEGGKGGNKGPFPKKKSTRSSRRTSATRSHK